MKTHSSLVSFCVLLALQTSPLWAMQDPPSYTPETHDLYSGWDNSGGPVVRNDDPTFIGAGLDWSGIGYGVVSEVISRAFISPIHAMGATHASPFPTGGPFFVADMAGGNPINLGGGTSEPYGLSVYGGNYNDTSIGRLTTRHIAPDMGISTYAMFDIPTSPHFFDFHNAQTYLSVGHGNSSLSLSPRIASSSGRFSFGGIGYSYPDVPVQGGDSGGPIMSTWTNPLGEREVIAVGVHAATNFETSNHGRIFMYPKNGLDLSGLEQANRLMTPYGFAARLRGVVGTTWSGAASSSFGTSGNWTVGVPLAEHYVQFDGATTAIRTLDFGGMTRSMRGLVFGQGGLGQGFLFQNGTLQLGPGGIASYSEGTQVFGAGLAVKLTDHQYWDAIHGGLEVNGSVDLAGKLLVVQGDFDTTINGAVADSAATATGLTKYGMGTLTLNGASSHRGTTWIYGGTLRLGSSGSLTGNTVLALANNDTVRFEMNGRTVTTSALRSIEGQPGARATIDLGSGGALVVDQADGVSDFSGRIIGGTSGTTALTLRGPTVANEIVRLSGASDFSGRTLIDRGNVYLSHTQALGATGAGNDTIIAYTDATKPSVRIEGTGVNAEAFTLHLGGA
jgi:autotransporter-associated beta strand protein